jgi:hypothetical protein
VNAINLNPEGGRDFFTSQGTRQAAELAGTVDGAAYGTPPTGFPVGEIGATEPPEIFTVFNRAH